MAVLIACRFVMGFGLGAENVVGYADHDRIRAGEIARQMVGLHHGVRGDRPGRSSLLVGVVDHSAIRAGDRCSCSAASAGADRSGICARALPEIAAPGLEAVGRTEEAEALMQSIEREGRPGAGPLAAARRPLRPSAASGDIATLFTGSRCCRA